MIIVAFLVILGLCRKKRDDQGKAVLTEGRDRVKGINQQKSGRPEQWVVKNRETTVGKATNTPQVQQPVGIDGQNMGNISPSAENVIL